MEAILLGVAAALGVQFLCLPLLIGARRGAEAVGWTMILGIFFAIPSAAVYLLVFALLAAVSPSPLATLLLGALAPPAAAAAFYWRRERWRVLGRQNYVVRMLLAGGIAGATVMSGLIA